MLGWLMMAFVLGAAFMFTVFWVIGKLVEDTDDRAEHAARDARGDYGRRIDRRA